MSSSPFREDVFAQVAKIPAGYVATYGEIARSLDKPKNARAVGQAMRNNPHAWVP